MLKTLGVISAMMFLSLHPFSSFSQKKVPPDYIVKVVSDKPTLFCHPGENVNYTITVLYKGDTVRQGKIKWRISKDGLEPPLKQGLAALNEGHVTVTGSLNEPGFLQCRADFTPPPGFRASTGRSGVAVDPLKIKPGLPPPDDFDAYWDKQKKLLAAVPLNVRITKVQSPIEGVECFDVQADCLGAPMSAYMARPAVAAPKTLPATLLLHGAGVASSRLGVVAQWAKDGFLALDFNAHGLPNGMPQKYYSDLYKGAYAKYYMKNPVHRDSIFFRSLYIRLLRALDVLTMQPEWDGKRLVANGRSQGGGQAFAAAGLDKRVTFFVAQIPAMCDHTGVAAGRINGWPKLVPFDEAGKPDPIAMQAVRYFDGANFATRTKAAAFVTVGFIDVSCPPSSVYAAYNCLKGKKEIINQYFTGHVVRADADSLVKEAVLKNVFGEKYYKEKLEKDDSARFKRSNSQRVARKEEI